jgi:hypothetical protein
MKNFEEWYEDFLNELKKGVELTQEEKEILAKEMYKNYLNDSH